MAVWHRRAGKDDACLHFTACAALQRVGTYWHMLPEASQARKAIWDAVNPHTGQRRIDEAFPKRIRSNERNSDMMIRFVNGSTWQVVGSDNYNSLIGSPPVGIVFSEYAVADPASWDYLRPILAENGGWALFIYTPRGRNHGHALYDMARGNPDWFAELLTVDDTGAIDPLIIDEERASGMDEDKIQQEYYCSFTAPHSGSYYGKLLETAEKESRIGRVPYETNLRVHTAWDLGIGDSTSIWFVQLSGREIRLIDHYENNGEGLDHYAKVLQEKPYVYGDHLVPHDAEAKELGTGKTRVEVMSSLGLKTKVVPVHKVDDGISAVRTILPRCWFDRTKCEKGLDALASYHKEWDDKLKTYKDKPKHDWSSHAADAFRYLAMGADRIAGKPKKLPKRSMKWVR